MGSLLGTADGDEITGVASGAVFLDFVAGTITLPAGSTAPLVRDMNKNLNDLGLNQCNSIGIWTSDADSTIFLGSVIAMSDHQLSHVINNYAFSNVRIEIPTNSTPNATNQIFFMASTDNWLGYSFPHISHQRSEVSGTSTTAQSIILSKHVGAYNQFMITTSNTGGANSIDVQIEFSENGTDFFPDSGYTTAVTVAPLSYNAFASEIEHHFYRLQINSTSAGNHSAYIVFWNFVNDRGMSGR